MSTPLNQDGNTDIVGSAPDGASMGVYARAPIEYRNEIPAFSSTDEYSENYERIAHDHLQFAKYSGKNPFIEEECWVESEGATAILVKKYSREGQLILDIGVGLGRLLSAFGDLDRYGMDISLEYLAKAKNQGIEVCFARIEDTPYKDSTFDIVVCTDVLEHVLDLNLCMRKILRCLKPGGHLIVRVPYREELSAYAKADFPYRYAHLRSFDEFSLTLLFRKVFSVQVVEFTTVGRTLDWARMVYRFPIGNRTFAKAIRLVKKYLPTFGKALSFRLFTPVEINMVIRKPLS